MAEFTLRPALEEDFPAIRTLILETGINPTGLDWKRFIVAETADGQFAGCGQLKPHGDGSLELASIAVNAAYRGRGVARLIIEKLLDDAPRPLYLTCKSGLGSFYERFGFRGIGYDDMPRYFQRISKLAGLANALHVINESLLVMKLDGKA